MSDSDDAEETSASPQTSKAKRREQIRPAILSVLALTVLTGCVFPLLLAIARPLFPRQAGRRRVSS
jgi:hypothetical protein